MTYVSITLAEAKERLAALESDGAIIEGLLTETLYTYDERLSVAPEECYIELGNLSGRCHPALQKLRVELTQERVALKRAVRRWEEQMATTRLEINLDDHEGADE